MRTNISLGPRKGIVICNHITVNGLQAGEETGALYLTILRD